MVFFDLDQVLRDLSEEIWPGKEPESWEALCPDGRDIFSYINDNLDVLLTAPQTRFCKVIGFFNPTILTAQPEEWRKNSTIWIKKNVPDHKKIIYVKDPLDKLNIVTDSDWLVDDYPKFPSEKYLKNILLIDRKYNKDINSPFRIKKASTLMQVLAKIKKGS